MKPQIAMIGLVTNQFAAMRDFYRDIVGFEVQLELDGFVEFKSPSVRFAITTDQTMHEATGNPTYLDQKKGHSFELAFPADSPSNVDELYQEIIDKGAKSIKAPADMPWNQRTAFFADPDGNIHEIFANLS